MSIFRRNSTPEAQELTAAQQDLNDRFNHRDADPESAEYLAAHDRVIAAEKAARKRG